MVLRMPEYAFYYPNPVWSHSDWVKNLIIFFDGVALLVPDYMRQRPFLVDPAITTGLQEQGLLRILEPETFIDKATAEYLASSLTDIIASGALDNLGKESTRFHELSRSRLGYGASEELARMIHDALIQRGLARESEDGFSIPMHPTVHALILVLLAQLLRSRGKDIGIDLYPATDMPRIHAALGELLNQHPFASAGHVVSMDIETVGIDLSAMPLDEVLSFRSEQGERYRKYARDLRRFVTEIGELPLEGQQEALRERRAEIQDAAADLRRAADTAWKVSATSFAIGIAGAAWSIVHGGEPISSIFSLLGTAVGAVSSAPHDASAYSYLFSARTRFG